MSDGNLDNSQWELSKENIQPIKQGRKANVLSSAFDESQCQKLALKRQEFEKELRIYSRDDPIDVWYRYALWIQQNYPKGGIDGNLKKLLESCFTSLNSSGHIENKYRNDERFLDLWVKYINLCPCPLEIYQTLYTKNYCNGLAAFYENWAWEIEKTGNNKKANAIYLEGLDRKAKPVDSLEISYKKFQARVVEKMSDKNDDYSNENEENLASRVVLSALQGTGTKAKAPVDRVSTIIGSAGRIPTLAVKPKSNVGGGTSFKIYTDENASENYIPKESQVSSNGLPTNASLAKENVKDPTKWTKNKLKCSYLVPVEDVDYYNKPTFQVHSDDVSSQPQSTPARCAELSGILSTRKKDQEEWNVPLFIAEPFNPLVQPQYAKHKVYCGTEEFSFEELRAVAVLREEEEKRKQEEADAMKDEVKALKEQMKQQQELIASLLQKKETLSHSSKDSKKLYEDSWVSIHKSVDYTTNISRVNTDNLTIDAPIAAPIQSIKLGAAHSNLDLPRQLSNNSSNPASPTINTKFAKNIVTDIFSGTLLHNSVNSSELKASFDLPTGSKEGSSGFQIYQDNSSEPFNIYQDENNIPSKSNQTAPFTIFCDENAALPSVKQQEALTKDSLHLVNNENKVLEEEKHLVIKRKSVAPLALISDETLELRNSPSNYRDENEENICPKGYKQVHKKRHLAGILQPSEDIPFIPLEVQEKMEQDEAQEIENDNLDGIEPLNIQEPPEDFTIKVPVNPEAFEKMARFASTPRPMSFGLIPQSTKSTDSTMKSMPIKSEYIGIREDNEDTSSKNIEERIEDDKETGNKSAEEKSGELMPPPSNSNRSGTTENKTAPSTTPTTAIKNNLSPILEASREFRSSSSSSSDYTTTTFGGNSNFYGISHHTTTASRTLQFSKSRTSLGSIQNECYRSQQNEMTKSGYFADKSSRGESISEFPKEFEKPIDEAEEEEELQSSFDPDKVAAEMLRDIYEDLDTENFSSLKIIDEKEPLQKSPTVQDLSDCPIDIKKINFQSDIDPFCPKLQKDLLSALHNPVDSRIGFVRMDAKIPLVKSNIHLSLGKEMFHVKKAKGSGAYAQVFHASTIDPMNVTLLPSNIEESANDIDGDEESQMILKVQKPASFWEFYICYELRERLKKRRWPSNIIDSIMRINRGYFFSNGSILVSQFHKYGTLLDFVNKYKSTGWGIPENIVTFLMIQIITLLNALHSCSIIHGDVKPDNIMITGVPSQFSSDIQTLLKEKLLMVKFIDFGRSIDMKMFPNGTTFTKKVKTEGFMCCEMRGNHPWTYQTDLFGLACVAHILLFGSYMTVKKEDNRWKITGVTYQRRWKKEFWHNFFDKMLNIPSCSEIPDMDKILNDFIDLMKNHVDGDFLSNLVT